MVSPQDYARALALALRHTDPTHADQVITQFVAVVRKRGHSRLLPKVVAAFVREVRARERQTRAQVFVASGMVIKTHAKEIAESARTLSIPPETLTFTVDDTLVEGYRLRTRDRIVDASGKRALLELYRRLIAA